MGRESYITLATNDAYCTGALVLAASLRQTQTSKELTILITAGVTNGFRNLLKQFFDSVVEVEEIRNINHYNHGVLQRDELKFAFTKVQCWSVIQFSKAVYLDADTVVLHNVDELFEREELSAVPDPCWPDCFNSGVFVFRPSLETHRALLKVASEAGSFDGGDQGLLNTYFSDWLSKDISRRLPYVYNCICPITDGSELDFYTSVPAWVKFGGAIRVAHFSGPIKPWHRTSAAKRCNEVACFALLGTAADRRTISRTSGMLAYWWSLFLILVRPHLTSDMYLGDFQLERQSTDTHAIVEHCKAPLSTADLASFVPYQPSFVQTREPHVIAIGSPSPQSMVPYHPEFHETRWDYLHHGQRVDQVNRFKEHHEVPKTDQSLAAPIHTSVSMHLHSHPPPAHSTQPSSSQDKGLSARTESPPLRPSSTPQAGISFSPPPSYPPVQGVSIPHKSQPPQTHSSITSHSNESKIGESFPPVQPFTSPSKGTRDVDKPSVWQPLPPVPAKTACVYSFDCPECRKDLAKFDANSLKRVKSYRHEIEKSPALKLSVTKTRKASKGLSHISKLEKRAEHPQKWGKKKYEPTVVGPATKKITAGDKLIGGNLFNEECSKYSHSQWTEAGVRLLNALNLRSSTLVSKASGGETVYRNSQLPRTVHALDLAADMYTHQTGISILGGSHTSTTALNISPENQNVSSIIPGKQTRVAPKSRGIFTFDRTTSTNSITLETPGSSPGIICIHSSIITANICRTTSDSFEEVISKKQTDSDPSDKIASGLILHSSKRRTLSQLRKFREKHKIKSFDKRVAQSTWEDKEQIDKLCQQLVNAQPKKPGIGGQLGSLDLGNKRCAHHELLDTERMYAWERGQIDYTGSDRFANILAKLCDTMQKVGGETNRPIGLDVSTV
ncbi:Glycosyltransferase family 8 [Paragonimus heterotremus]|uniref:glycogenin glucosyltransferase n=1 Tax=Paragonimus heterotremus TaxID=100268 RepID=A0A8J4SZY1_9TREM|nr:Glycosyltransferase family 8 [Paragonimus heterotremus]